MKRGPRDENSSGGAPAVPVTDWAGERRAARQEAGRAQKGWDKGLGAKTRKAPGTEQGMAGGGWGESRGRKSEQKNPRKRTKGSRDGK